MATLQAIALPGRGPRRAERSARSCLGDRTATSAVEFALIAPTVVLLLIATVDFGTALYDRFALTAAISAAADYSILNATSVSASGGQALAQALGNILSSAGGSNWASAVATVNNGPSATLSGGVITLSGSSAPADLCYCPTPASGGGVDWGTSLTCGSTCSGGGIAGKFVTIAASVAFTSMFGANGLIPSQTFTNSSVVQAQ